MIKELEEIKIKKDLIHIKNIYGFKNASLARFLECNEKIIRDFLNKKTNTLSKKSFENIYAKLPILKKEIIKVEQYKFNLKGE